MSTDRSATPSARSERVRFIVRAFATESAIVFSILGLLELRLDAIHHQMSSHRPGDEATIPTPGAVRLLSLGHREWAADLLWCSALVYFGDTLATHQPQRYVQRYADTIEQVDPHFRPIYLWGATVSIYNAHAIRRDSVEASIVHLQRGLLAFPDDGEMLYEAGFDYFYELPRLLDSDAAKLDARRRGAEYLRRAAALGYGPPWMALAAASALQRAGLDTQAIDELRALYLRTDDPQVRETIAGQIREIEGENAARDPFLDEVQRVDAERRASLPYVPPSLYFFIGPPVPGVLTPLEASPVPR